MKLKTAGLALLATTFVVLISSCSTLSVKIPDDMYLSMGDYVEGVTTEGIIQVHKSVWTPFIVLYDASQVREDLYEQLIAKADDMIGVEGITNISFYSKPSVFSVLAPITFGAGIWMDYYAEGVVITID